MAYMNKERKAILAPAIKAVLKKYGMKGSIAVRNYSTLVVNIKEGSIDFNVDREYFTPNPYHFERHFADNEIAIEFFREMYAAMNGFGTELNNHDNSDIMTDYFDVGWYADINVGTFGKPYTLVA